MMKRVIFVIFILSCLLYSHALESQEEKLLHGHVVSVSSLLPSKACKPSRASSKDSIPLMYKYGPCSHGKMKIPTWSEILRKDRIRVESIKSRYMNLNRNGYSESKSKTFPFGYEQAIGGGEIYASLYLGTPGQPNFVILDTGSVITWIQCKPCIKCFKQLLPIFDTSKSRTLRTVPCNSSTCSSLQSPGPMTQCMSKKCPYSVKYGDGSYTFGEFVEDKLTIKSSNDKKTLAVVNNYKFGCGHNNSDILADANPNGSIGLMGLGRSPASFVYQTAALFKKYFSYCIPTDHSATGYLTFGEPKNINTKFVRFTPIPTSIKQSVYYDIIVTGISVAGKMLPIKSSEYFKSGAIIDSGTTTTRLPSKVYAELRLAFRKAMSRYKRVPGDSITDTCYDLSGYATVVVPKVKFFFKGGAELDVVVQGILFASDEKEVCLAFAGGDGSSPGIILGNQMQRSVEVVYDVGGQRVGFGPGTCA